jgi:hypothetical protein
MPYDGGCSTYWCDKCSRECVIDWHNSGGVYFVLKCTKCPWTKVFVAQSDVADRRDRLETLCPKCPEVVPDPVTPGGTFCTKCECNYDRGGNH